MTYTYKKCPEFRGVETSIIRKEDGVRKEACIPIDPENTDYQEYLEWLKIDGNVPEEAD